MKQTETGILSKDKQVNLVPDSYNMSEHTHRFAVWTAARAVQRNFTTTEVIETAINKTKLRDLAEGRIPEVIDQESYATFLIENSKTLIKELGKSVDKEKVTFGRAAKIIAVYLKTAVILPNKGVGVLCSLIHPPIDRILLTNIKKETTIDILDEIPNWTQLDQKGYFEIWKKLQSLSPEFPWKIEYYWMP
ncbi:MAG: hypothetical protein R2767_08955 [Chitinophagales bacterium]|nr:hypothetical protein [Bacteroidota bacterium]